jgi:hypothetical protein
MAARSSGVVLGRDHAGPVLPPGDPVAVGDPVAGVVGRAGVADLALDDQLVQGGDRLLERRLGVGAMVLVEVDVVGLEPAQARLDRPADVAAGATRLLLVAAHPRAELGGEHDLVPAALEDLAKERLRPAAVAVGVGGVEQVDVLVDGGVDNGAGPLQVQARAEVVAAEADHRDGQAGGAELAVAHPGVSPLPPRGCRRA